MIVPVQAIGVGSVLAASSRIPFALDEIRRLDETGHDVTAVDTFMAVVAKHGAIAPGAMRSVWRRRVGGPAIRFPGAEG